MDRQTEKRERIVVFVREHCSRHKYSLLLVNVEYENYCSVDYFKILLMKSRNGLTILFFQWSFCHRKKMCSANGT